VPGIAPFPLSLDMLPLAPISTCTSKYSMANDFIPRRDRGGVLSLDHYLLRQSHPHLPLSSLTFLRQIHTNRLLPNAWPSAQMISKSVYLQEVTSRHPFTYLTRLFTLNPLHFIGLLFGTLFIFILLYQLQRSCNSSPPPSSHHLAPLLPSLPLHIALLAIWPLSFLLGLTLIGLLGGGYQIRFILPILPATSILTAICITSSGMRVVPLVNLLLCYASFHLLYYSILYPPLIADFDVTIFEILEMIVTSTLDLDSQSKDSLLSIYKYMKHFGLAVRV
jgi:hypothetical protein